MYRPCLHCEGKKYDKDYCPEICTYGEARKRLEEIEEALAEHLIANGAVVPEHNATLTLDELHQMDGEPVWVENTSAGQSCWMLAYKDCAHTCNHLGYLDYSDYGKSWVAYRRKPTK